MSTHKKYNLAGEVVGEVTIDERFTNYPANKQMIKDYIRAIRQNLRQWSACTKTRSEVKHTTKKSQPQKGQGRARHGSLVAPQYRGGGIAFGPKPKFDQHIRINKKERQAAIRHLIGEKIVAGDFFVVDALKMEQPKTKEVVSFLNQVGINGRVLFLGETSCFELDVGGTILKADIRNDIHDAFILSMRNLPKAAFKLASNVSGYDLLLAQKLVVSEQALNELTTWLA